MYFPSRYLSISQYHDKYAGATYITVSPKAKASQQNSTENRSITKAAM